MVESDRLPASDRLVDIPNYSSWSPKIRTILESKSLEDYILPTCKKPEVIHAPKDPKDDSEAAIAAWAKR
jgi:hypothetical protein